MYDADYWRHRFGYLNGYRCWENITVRDTESEDFVEDAQKQQLCMECFENANRISRDKKRRKHELGPNCVDRAKASIYRQRAKLLANGVRKEDLLYILRNADDEPSYEDEFGQPCFVGSLWADEKGGVYQRDGFWYYSLEEVLDACENEREHRSEPQATLGAFVVDGRDTRAIWSILDRRPHMKLAWRYHTQIPAQRASLAAWFIRSFLVNQSITPLLPELANIIIQYVR